MILQKISLSEDLMVRLRKLFPFSNCKYRDAYKKKSSTYKKFCLVAPEKLFLFLFSLTNQYINLPKDLCCSLLNGSLVRELGSVIVANSH